MTHYPNQESSSDEWRREIDHLDDRDPDGFYYLGKYNPDWVGCLEPKEVKDEKRVICLPIES